MEYIDTAHNTPCAPSPLFYFLPRSPVSRPRMEPSIPVFDLDLIGERIRLISLRVLAFLQEICRTRERRVRGSEWKKNSGGRKKKKKREGGGGKERRKREIGETRNRERATHHECPHGCCCSLIWGLMLRGCLVAPFYTGQLGGPTRCLDPSPMRCDGAIANLSRSLSLFLSILAIRSGTAQICLCTFVEIHPLDSSTRIGSVASTRDTHASHSVDSMTNEREKWTIQFRISRRSQEFI